MWILEMKVNIVNVRRGFFGDFGTKVAKGTVLDGWFEKGTFELLERKTKK